MKNKTNLTTLIVLMIIMGIFTLSVLNGVKKIPNQNNSTLRDYLNTSYEIDGKSLQFISGMNIQEIPGSASKITNRIFGLPTIGDLNEDGTPDYAMFIQSESGGSGTFYYVAAAIKNRYTGDVQGTNAMFLGDRLAIQTINIQNGVIIANYADRIAGQPMTSAPSIGVSRYFKIEGNSLVEIPNPNSL